MKILLGLFLPFSVLMVCILGCSSFESAIGFNDSPEGKAYNRIYESDEKKAARPNLTANFQASKNSTKNVLVLDITINNASDFAVKDFLIECRIYGASNTELELKKQTIFEILKPKEKKIVKEINLGFVNKQMANYGCQLDDFSLVD